VTGPVASLGALGVFLLMVPESACVPVPSEVTLLFSGFAVSQGWLSFPLAVLAATGGNLVGSLLAYGIGASGCLERLPAVRSVLRRWGGFLDRHGSRAVFVARLLPLARTFVSLPAGARRVPLGRFVALTVAGCLLWSAGFMTIGLLAGRAWGSVSGLAGRIGVVAAIALLIVCAARSIRPRLG
jgi:membrane protein DedA with SNARE-associated domain